LGYEHKSDDAITNFREVLEQMQQFIQEGKIRHIGISNETPWGLIQYLNAASVYNLPKVVTLQNPYNLINRVFEVGLAEICIREKVGLMTYSPLAGGLLSDKYLNGQRPEGARFTRWPNYFTRYSHPNTIKAVQKYADLAKESGLSFPQMALAFNNSRKFVTCNIIGATSMYQLEENIGSINLKLSEDILGEIQKIHLEYPNPAP
jgi:aryl-alcohol dehydrogenase-like predicted oxidoreductase